MSSQESAPLSSQEVPVPIRQPGFSPSPSPSTPNASPSNASLPATDGRRDMMKELIASNLVLAGSIDDAIRAIVTKSDELARAKGDKSERTDKRGNEKNLPDLKPTRPTSSSEKPSETKPSPSSQDLQRALQLLQRESGLPPTGRFDDATLALLKNLGIGQPKPEAPKAPAPAPTPAAAPERKPVDAATKADARARAGGGADAAFLRAKLQAAAGLDAKGLEAKAADKGTPLDRAFDPARLLASLFAAGFTGNGQEAVQAFQKQQGLPPSGQLDKQTTSALVAAGHLSEAAAHEATSTSTSMAAGGAGSTSASDKSADNAKASKDSRAQAQTAEKKTAGETATRAPASSAAEARERARLESLLAQAAATERGVTEQSGDPTATAGHGTPAEQAGSGVSGHGGQGGGAVTATGEEAAAVVAGEAGDEDSVGNAVAGDDDHDDDRRGNASDVVDDAADDADDGPTPAGYYRVAKLSEQVKAALETLARLDDGTVPVHYTWDVTLHRPGVYADGQPAEALWHLVVERAHAFDPVWARAAQAIAARLLYAEPDADMLTLDDIQAALKRARVR